MTATGFGAILVVAGAVLLLLGPSLARSQADLLSGFFQVNLRERGMRAVLWSYLIPGAGLLLVGLVLIVLAQTGVIEDTDPLSSGDGGQNGIFTAAVVVFMVGTFLLTLVLMFRLWRRGWPGRR